MGNINISIKEEAYDFLRRLGSGKKSFSEVILSFKKMEENAGTNKIMKFFGVLKDKDFSETEDEISKFRLSFNKRILNDRT